MKLWDEKGLLTTATTLDSILFLFHLLAQPLVLLVLFMHLHLIVTVSYNCHICYNFSAHCQSPLCICWLMVTHMKAG